jgi:hypothetical protein
MIGFKVFTQKLDVSCIQASLPLPTAPGTHHYPEHFKLVAISRSELILSNSSLSPRAFLLFLCASFRALGMMMCGMDPSEGYHQHHLHSFSREYDLLNC